MIAIVLKGSDGRRWLIVEGSGLCTELKAGPEPAPPKIRAPKKRVKRWDGF